MKYIFLTLIVLATLIFLWWVLFYIGWMPAYSEGERTVDVYKFSKKGIWFKSWEGEAYVGGVRGDGNGNLQLDRFYFSIPEDEEDERADLIDKIKECASDRDTDCTIIYRQWFKSPIYIDSRYVVEDIKFEQK